MREASRRATARLRGRDQAIEVLKAKAPANGLSLEENRELAMAVDIQIIIPLLLRGLRETVHQRYRPMAR